MLLEFPKAPGECHVLRRRDVLITKENYPVRKQRSMNLIEGF